MEGFVPSWLTPANPAEHMARGLQIGAQIGAQQAAQRFQEQQMARYAQEEAMQQARWEASFGLQSANAARKNQAILEYQKRVGAGEDPMKVLIDLGPAMEVPGAEVAAALRVPEQQAHNAMIQDLRERSLDERTRHWLATEQLNQTHKSALEQIYRTREADLEAYRKSMAEGKGKLSEAGRLAAIDRIERAKDRLLASVPQYADRLMAEDIADPKWDPMRQKAYKATQDRLKALDAQISDLQNEGSGLGLEAPPPGPSVQQWGRSPSGLPMRIGGPPTAPPTTTAVGAPPPPRAPPAAPLPPETQSFINAMKRAHSGEQLDAWNFMGDKLAKEIGPAPDSPLLQIGSSSLFHKPGSVYSTALHKGVSDYMPDLTRGKVWDYIMALPEDTRNDWFSGALKNAGIAQ